MEFGTKKLIKLKEVDEEFVLLKNLFYMNSVSVSTYCPVIEIHCNAEFMDTREACLDALFLFSDNLLQRPAKNLGITYHWLGLSKDAITKIFSDTGASRDNGSVRALYLSQHPQYCAIDSILSAQVDDKGLKHVVFCRIMSRDLPQVAMTWNPDVDKHIQPLYVVTIKPVGIIEDLLRKSDIESLAMSPLVLKKMPETLAMLSEHLSLPMMYLLRKAFNDCQEQKISCESMSSRMREIAGDELLARVM